MSPMVRDAIRSPIRATRLLAGAPEPHRCPACGGRVTPDEHAVRVRDDLFHAGCALYRRRGGADRR